MIQSPVSIVFTPEGGPGIVIVAAGGWLDQLPGFDASQDLYEADGITLAHGYFRPLGNVTVECTITPEADHGDLAAALDAYLDDGDVLEVAGTLSVGEWVFEDTVMTSENPDLPSGPTSTTLRSFQFKTSLPTPPDP